MDSIEFINKLQSALYGKVPDQVVEESVAFYKDYINGRIIAGDQEHKILAELGEPRLIARSITDAYKQGNGANTSQNTGRYYDSSQMDQEYGYAEQFDTFDNRDLQRDTRKPIIVKPPAWLTILAVVGISVVVLKVVIPLLIPVLIVYFVYRLFKDVLK